MYYALAPLVGALFTVMNGVNSRLAGLAGSLVAVLAIHLAGLAAVSIALLAGRRPRRGGHVAPVFYLGGFFGVGTVFASNYAFGALGASLAVALALIGQTLFSLAADATGLLGRRKYPLSARGLPGIALAFAGAAIMANNWRTDAPAMLAALAAGALPGLTFILNSELGKAKGVLGSTRINYLGGLATTLAIVAAACPPFAAGSAAAASESLRKVVAAGPVLALGGGLMGVAAVTSMNAIYPRMPAFSATLLVFSGQAIAGLLIDLSASGSLDARKLAGTLLLLAGLAAKTLLSRGAQAAPRAEGKEA